MRFLVWLVSRSDWVMDRYRGTRGILGRAVVRADVAVLKATAELLVREMRRRA